MRSDPLVQLLRDPNVRKTIWARIRYLKEVQGLSNDELRFLLSLSVEPESLSACQKANRLPRGRDRTKLLGFCFNDYWCTSAEFAQRLRAAQEEHQQGLQGYNDDHHKYTKFRPGTVDKLWEDIDEVVEQTNTPRTSSPPNAGAHVLCEAASLPFWALPPRIIRRVAERAKAFGDLDTEGARGLLSFHRRWQELLFPTKIRVRGKLIIHVVVRGFGLRRLICRQWPFGFLKQRDLDEIIEFVDLEVISRAGARFYISPKRPFIPLDDEAYWERLPRFGFQSLGTITCVMNRLVVYCDRVDSGFGVEHRQGGSGRAHWNYWFNSVSREMRRWLRPGRKEHFADVLQQWNQEAIEFRQARSRTKLPSSSPLDRRRKGEELPPRVERE